MNTFDQIARQLCKQDGEAFFRWVLRDRPDWGLLFRAWDDARRLPLPGQPDRTNDLVGLFDHPNSRKEALGLVEVQVEADWAIFPRLGNSELLAVQERASRENPYPLVFTVLLNLTGENAEVGWHSSLGGTSERPVVLNLRNRSCESLLDAIERDQLSPILLPWVPLHEDGGEATKLERWLQLIGKEPSPERRAMIREFTLIFAELSKKLVWWQKALKDWTMLESQIVLGWLKRERIRAS